MTSLLQKSDFRRRKGKGEGEVKDTKIFNESNFESYEPSKATLVPDETYIIY